LVGSGVGLATRSPWTRSSPDAPCLASGDDPATACGPEVCASPSSPVPAMSSSSLSPATAAPNRSATSPPSRDVGSYGHRSTLVLVAWPGPPRWEGGGRTTRSGAGRTGGHPAAPPTPS